MKKYKVLIIDDSSIMRKLLHEILSSSSLLEVVDTASDPYIAREKIAQYKPDIITLDIEMPKMDGLTFLGKLMKHYPIRTVIISSLSQKGSQMALDALELGAIDVIAKPALDLHQKISLMGQEIIERVIVAASCHWIPREKNTQVIPQTEKKQLLTRTTQQILAIAGSTGGTEALKEVLKNLPTDIPGTVIVQHMPPVFTKTFADNLNKICKFEVREAKDGDILRTGLALIAPGNYHMLLLREGAQYKIILNQEERIHGVRPAADPLFDSVAEYAGKNAIGVILTGMGKDGALGLKKMKEKGAYNIAQDERSCVVFGMPKEAIALGGIDKVLDIQEIPKQLIKEFEKRDLAREKKT